MQQEAACPKRVFPACPEKASVQGRTAPTMTPGQGSASDLGSVGPRAGHERRTTKDHFNIELIIPDTGQDQQELREQTEDRSHPHLHCQVYEVCNVLIIIFPLPFLLPWGLGGTPAKGEVLADSEMSPYIPDTGLDLLDPGAVPTQDRRSHSEILSLIHI